MNLGKHSFERHDFRLVFSLLLSLTTLACSTNKPIYSVEIKSPLGVYQSDSQQKYWIEIKAQGHYSLCSASACDQGQYETVPVKYGVILLDFYSSDIGLEIEQLSHGTGYDKAYYAAMKAIRQTQPRADDLAFNIGNCDGVPCVGIGHKRDGVRFYKLPSLSDTAVRTDRQVNRPFMIFCGLRTTKRTHPTVQYLTVHDL